MKFIKVLFISIIIALSLTACSFFGVRELGNQESQKKFLEMVEEKYNNQKDEEAKFEATGDFPVTLENKQVTFHAIVKVDGKNSATSLSIADTSVEFRKIDDKSFVGDGKDIWYELSETDAESLQFFDSASLTSAFDTKVDDLKWTYNGLVECNSKSEKCHSFEIEENDAKATYLFGPDDHLIYQFKGELEAENVTLDFSYENVSISAPDNATPSESSDGAAGVYKLLIDLYKAAGIDISVGF